MKTSNALVIFAIAAAMLFAGAGSAQTPRTYYYDDTEWPLPPDGGTSAFKLNGMTSAHAVWMSFTRYAGDKPMMDSPVIMLLPGSIVKWTAPRNGCNYELELVNANPPLINMKKPASMCSLNPGAKVVFRILATP